MNIQLFRASTAGFRPRLSLTQYVFHAPLLAVAISLCGPPAAHALTPVGKLKLVPRALKFPKIQGGSSETLSFMVQNAGKATLTGSVGTPSSGIFEVLSGGGAFSLDPGAAVTVQVQFSPRLAGKYKATIPITVTTQKKPSLETLLGAVTPQPSGKVVVAGGWISTVAGTNTAEVYDAVTGKFTPAPNMSDSRSTHAAAWLDPAIVSGAEAGLVFLSGGQDTADFILASTLLYDLSHNSFSGGPDGITPRAEHTATLLTNGRVLIDGGLTFDFAGNIVGINSAELYDPATNSINPTGFMNDSRGEQTATLLTNGLVLITGGLNDTFDTSGFVVATDTAELYDPASGTFSCVGGLNSATGFCKSTMSKPRWEHEATLLADGTVLITGGITTDLSDRAGTVSADLYDPVANTISAVGNMIVPREGHTATLIEGCQCPADRKVLITGGQNQTGAVISSAELYDPVSKTFTATGSMHSPRATHDAVGFRTGQLAGFVLITGGYAKPGGAALRSAELYDPVHGRFETTGSMKHGRYEHTATLIPPSD